MIEALILGLVPLLGLTALVVSGCMPAAKAFYATRNTVKVKIFEADGDYEILPVRYIHKAGLSRRVVYCRSRNSYPVYLNDDGTVDRDDSWTSRYRRWEYV